MPAEEERATGVLATAVEPETNFGVDGCPAGWVAAFQDGRAITFEIFERFADVHAAARSRAALVVVDIPIGLPSGGPRACDIEARKLLGLRRASVFPAPCRATISATSFEDACEREMRARGRRITQQGFAIFGKIREVDECLGPTEQGLVREAHPEVSFALLSGRGTGLSFKKKSAAGRKARQEILEAAFGASFDVAAEQARLGRDRVGKDDLLDALACLATARRIQRGTAIVIPADRVELDARSLRMEIVA